MDEIIKIIDAVVANLNLIEVRGQSNLAILYNSIDTLKNLEKGLSNPVVTKEVIEDYGHKEAETDEHIQTPSE